MIALPFQDSFVSVQLGTQTAPAQDLFERISLLRYLWLMLLSGADEDAGRANSCIDGATLKGKHSDIESLNCKSPNSVRPFSHLSLYLSKRL